MVRIAAAAVVAVVALGAAASARPALATPEGSITYSVYQTPAAGSVLQVGSVLSFRVDVTSAPGAFTGPIAFDLRKPANTTFASFGQQSGNIITSCADNTPFAGYLRCTVGNGAGVAAGALETGTATEIVVNFTLDAGAAGTVYLDADIQGLFSDAGSGFRNALDAADPVGGGDTLDSSVGGFTVTNILGANANISVSTAASPSAVFEGGLSTITVSFSHGLGVFGATAAPIDVNVTNADVQGGSIACPGGSGTPTVLSGTARCTASSVANGSVMSFVVRARDTAAGDDIVVTVAAPSLGLSSLEAAGSSIGTATQVVSVNEVGLESVSLPGPNAGAAPPWAAGNAIAVCTMAVANDGADDRAAGAAQSPALVAGTSTLSPVTPLAVGDFAVTGPSGPVAFTYLDAGAANCGANQSGVQFTPAAAGSYTVIASYNGDTTSGSTRNATKGTSSLALAVATTNPVPAVASISPSAGGAGGPGFALTVNGSSFVPGSVVRWNGADRPTTFVTASQLTATIAASDIAAQGSATVTVYNAAPGGGTSNGASFTVTGAPNPAPSIGGLAPASATAGSPAFTMTVNGSNFVNGAVVRWNGSDRATTFISATQVTANVLSGDIAANGTANVQVFNPAPGGGLSPAAVFTIGSAPNPAPAVTSLSPNTGTAGGAAFTLTVNGSGFAPSSVVRWNGSDRATTYVSASQVTAAILSSDLTATGPAPVTVYTAAPGGGASSAVTFTVNNPAPAATSISPTSAVAGASGFTLTVNGSGFVSTSVVRWNGGDRTTTFVSATQLTASIGASDLATAGTAPVTVYNAAPGGGTSSPLTFTVNNPSPGAGSLSPNSATRGDAAITLAVTGSNFTSSSVVRWDGNDRTTTFVSATQLTAAIPAADLAAAGTVNVSVFTPSPGGGASSPPLVFTVNNPVPAVTTLSPDHADAGGAAFTITVMGTGFVNGAKVRWNGADRNTTFVSATQLTAEIAATDIASTATVVVTVFTPTPGGGASPGITFTVGTPSRTASDQLVVVAGPAGTKVSRSRLSFTATSGSLATPSTVTFVIKRTSDGKYWNGATGTWESTLFENPGTVDSSGVWHYAVIGSVRRLFTNTAVTVEARAVVGVQPYSSALVPEIQVR